MEEKEPDAKPLQIAPQDHAIGHVARKAIGGKDNQGIDLTFARQGERPVELRARQAILESRSLFRQLLDDRTALVGAVGAHHVEL